MRIAQIEAWVISAVERAIAGLPNEDSRVELKSGWPEAEKAARRIAGHANASRGEPVLWIVGIDGKQCRVLESGVVEAASWWAGVTSMFDGVPPEMVDLVVPTPHGVVVALLFQTDRTPFVTVNPAAGKTRGEAVQREVPWREATGVRSAYRHELLTLLVPLLPLPELELHWASVTQELGQSAPGDPPGPIVDWGIDADLYVITKTPDRVVVPFHRCTLSIEVEGFTPRIVAPQLSLGAAHQPGGPRGSSTISGGSTEAIINGPGTLRVHASFSTAFCPTPPRSKIALHVSLHPVGAAQPVSVQATLTSRTQGTWTLKEPPRSRRLPGGQSLPPLIE